MGATPRTQAEAGEARGRPVCVLNLASKPTVQRTPIFAMTKLVAVVLAGGGEWGKGRGVFKCAASGRTESGPAAAARLGHYQVQAEMAATAEAGWRRGAARGRERAGEKQQQRTRNRATDIESWSEQNLKLKRDLMNGQVCGREREREQNRVEENRVEANGRRVEPLAVQRSGCANYAPLALKT